VRHIHAHFASTAASVALHVYRLTGIPYSFTAHAKDIYRRTVTPRDVGRKLRAARFAVTVSDYNLRYLRAFPGGDRVVRIYNGVDLVQFAPNGVARDDPPLVLGVGRLVEKKGFGDLVRACRILRDQGHDFACRIVGSGERASSLRELVEELGVGGCVELVGPMAREDLLGLYPRASVVAAPCVVGTDGNRDGLPTVLIEAMALGVPVVATHVTGIPELVRPGITGLLVPERDPRALARAIAEVIGNEAAARGRARAARALIERDFDLRKNVAHLRRRLEASR
jgi:glycosyltransferase involved in cell wall biosynthesis